MPITTFQSINAKVVLMKIIHMKRNWKRKISYIILAAVAGVFIFTGVVMLLWNAILPAVLHVGLISFWQAMGILVLAKLLFGGFRGRRHMGGMHWKHRMRMRWNNMTDEEKEKYKQRFGCYDRRWQSSDDATPAV